MGIGVGERHRASRSVNDRGFRSAGRAPCACRCASGQNYAFASNRTRGLSLLPRRITAISPQRKRRHRQTGGRGTAFSTHGSRPIATKREGANRVRPTARRPLGAFRKKAGTFSTILPRFLRKVSHFLRQRTDRVPPRRPFAKAAPDFGQSTGAHGPPQRRRCNEYPAVGRRQGRKKPDGAKNPREDVGRRA